jgi:hypothetical protein
MMMANLDMFQPFITKLFQKCNAISDVGPFGRVIELAWYSLLDLLYSINLWRKCQIHENKGIA